MSNFDFTDKANESVVAAVQLAKDYAQAQGMYICYHLWYSVLTPLAVQPAHLAFVLLNEGSADAQSSPSSGAAPRANSGASLFQSVIERAGGDPVRVISSHTLLF
jgi:ATP-dependent Clp protease ATP-binding subunit ClpB